MRFSMETVHMDTRSVRWEDIIFCGGRDHRLTYDILIYQVKIVLMYVIYLLIYVIVRFQCVMPHRRSIYV